MMRPGYKRKSPSKGQGRSLSITEGKGDLLFAKNIELLVAITTLAEAIALHKETCRFATNEDKKLWTALDAVIEFKK